MEEMLLEVKGRGRCCFRCVANTESLTLAEEKTAGILGTEGGKTELGQQSV